MKRYLLALALLPTLASAQTAPWNENTIAWDAPTTCTSGQPITACQIVEYRVYRSATTDGGYARVGSTPILPNEPRQFRHVNAAEGRNCYYVTAFSPVAGESVPSVVACKTNVAPSGPPNPPTNLRFITQAVIGGMNTTPIYGVTASGTLSATVYGFVPTGRSCDGTAAGRVGTYRGLEFRKVDVRNPATELWGVTPAQAAGMRFAAACRGA